MKKRLIDFIAVILVLIFIFILIKEPQICKDGAITGVLISGRVIIPALLPFTMCVLFIINSKTIKSLDFLSPITFKITSLSAEIFIIILFSFIGGYPIGAKLLNEAVKDKKITPSQAGNMLNFCINAGPAFIVMAVGNGILGSKKMGILLLCSHILSSILIGLIFRKNGFMENKKEISKNKGLNPIDNFVFSSAEASKAVINICSFVILFSVINSYILFLGERVVHFKILRYFLEVTNGVSATENIYLISFILGFGGLSVWCQVLAVAREIKINYIHFLFFRVLHAVFSVLITAVLLKIFPVALKTFYNGQSFGFSHFYSTSAIGASLLIMAIVFIISLNSKNYAGKIFEDIV